MRVAVVCPSVPGRSSNPCQVGEPGGGGGPCEKLANALMRPSSVSSQPFTLAIDRASGAGNSACAVEEIAEVAAKARTATTPTEDERKNPELFKGQFLPTRHLEKRHGLRAASDVSP